MSVLEASVSAAKQAKGAGTRVAAPSPAKPEPISSARGKRKTAAAKPKAAEGRQERRRKTA